VCLLYLAIDFYNGVNSKFPYLDNFCVALPKRFSIMKDFLGRALYVIFLLISQGLVELIIGCEYVLDRTTGLGLAKGDGVYEYLLVGQH
jgi:hypothetical protein